MVFRLRPRPGRAYLAGAPLLVAHRGGSRLAPENTMAAFESAVRDWGADMLELDVRLSKDGVVMVIHDDSVPRRRQKGGNAVGANVVAPVGTQRVGRAELIAHPVPLA